MWETKTRDPRLSMTEISEKMYYNARTRSSSSEMYEPGLDHPKRLIMTGGMP
jgi:hypothetical protein